MILILKIYDIHVENASMLKM